MTGVRYLAGWRVAEVGGVDEAIALGRRLPGSLIMGEAVERSDGGLRLARHDPEPGRSGP